MAGAIVGNALKMALTRARAMATESRIAFSIKSRLMVDGDVAQKFATDLG